MTDLSSSPTGSGWHVSAVDLERYGHGAATQSLAASVEPHLEACAQCRDGLTAITRSTAQVGENRLNRLLDEVINSVDRPRPSLLERLLCHLGVADHVARLLVATPAMQSSWIAAVATTLGFTVLATRSGGLDFGVFLAVAPLVPLAAVAAAFALPNDTTAELTVTVPVRTSWLLMLRSVSVLVTTLLLCGVAAVALPSHGWENAAWVLPALALATASAALSTWVQPLVAAGALAAAWVAILLATVGPIARRLHSLDSSSLVENSAAFAPSGQLLALGVICISLLALLSRREVLDRWSAT